MLNWISTNMSLHVTEAPAGALHHPQSFRRPLPAGVEGFINILKDYPITASNAITIEI